MRFGAVPVVMTIVVLAGCSNDATGPGAANVRLEVYVDGPYVVQPTPQELEIQCNVGLSALADGGRITWVDGTVYFYAGPDRKTPLDSVLLKTTDMPQLWGAPDLESGHSLTSSWFFAASVPFAATFSFRYKAGAAMKKASASFNCGPDIPPGSSPPSLRQVAIVPAGGEIENGDTITVSYTADAQAGLWQTIVEMSGACAQEFKYWESYATSVTRTVPIIVPAGCEVGGDIDVKVRAFDIGLRGVELATGPPLAFVDHTPPTVGGGLDYYILTDREGFLFTGDTLRGGVGAADNNRLAGAFWEVWPAGRRDSMKLAEQSIAANFTIPIPNAWAGKIQMRFYSRDMAGLTSDTLYLPIDSLRIYPTVSRPLRFTSPIVGMRAMTLDVRRNKAWVLLQEYNVSIHWIYGIDLTTMAITDTISVPGGWDLDLTPSGDSLIVLAVYGLGVIDLRSATRVVARIPLTSVDSTLAQYPLVLRVAGNGKVFVILVGRTVQENTLVEADLQTGTDHVRTDAGNGGVVNGVHLERSLDYSALFLNGAQGIQRYSSATDAFTAPQAQSSGEWGLAVDETGSTLTIGWDLYDGAMQFLRHMDTPSPYSNIPTALSPDGSRWYHTNYPQGVMSSNTNDGRLIDRQRTPQSLYMKMFPDGSKLVFIDAQFDRVGVIDLR